MIQKKMNFLSLPGLFPERFFLLEWSGLHFGRFGLHFCQPNLARRFTPMPTAGFAALSTLSRRKLSDELMWFIGFSEGDGCLYTDGSRHWFILTQMEVSPLYRVRRILGYGSVRSFLTPEGRICFRLVVTRREGIQKLIELFNGRLVCLSKKKQLNQWISVWNQRYPKDKIAQSASETEPSKADAWFSGFFDAEGGFSISISPRASRKDGLITSRAKDWRVRPRVFCDQKEKEVLQKILENFQVGRVSARASDRSQFRWMVDTWDQAKKIESYFQRYSLRTRKQLVFLRWRKLLCLYVCSKRTSNG